MKVEIISVSSQLLVSDILDTSASHVARSLHQVGAILTRRVIVGDNLELIVETINIAKQWANMIIVIGHFVVSEENFLWQALAIIRQQMARDADSFSFLYGPDSAHAGLMLNKAEHTLFCLPDDRYVLEHVLETAVLPAVRQQLKLPYYSQWALLHTVGIMESTLKERLADLAKHDVGHIAYYSIAGQTNIRLWSTGQSEIESATKLVRLKKQVLARVGKYVFGEDTARLEDVVLHLLKKQQRTLTIAEFYTEQCLFNSFVHITDATSPIKWLSATDSATVAKQLNRPALAQIDNLNHWCRTVAQEMLELKKTTLGLLVYNHLTQGGVQVLVTLASPTGVSVINRSFSGHPDYINRWACTLGLSRLYRWLMGHDEEVMV